VSALTAPDRAKLIKIMAVLSSDKPGERVAAAEAAHRLVTQRGLTWSAVIERAPVKREPGHGTWRRTCAELIQRPHDLRPWERKFVADLPAFPRISTKQRYILKEIADRVLGRAA
jgi:hypothetical protein